MAEKKPRKKRFTFADAKEEIKQLKSEIEKLNVDLSDNVVTQEELKVLKIYKFGFFVAAGIATVLVLSLLF